MNIKIVIAIITTATLNVSPIRAGDTTKPIWTVTKNVGAPSNALFDPETKTVFVSQISGKGDAKDGVGVVSRLHLDGKMINFEWAAGLDAPKGMARYGKNLWVSDIDRLRRVDAATGDLLETLPVPEANFLTGVAVDSDGTVYIADLLASKIYRYKNEKFTVLAVGESLESPAGLMVDKNQRLIVAAWGLTTDFTTNVPGRLLRIGSGNPTPISDRIGNLYGLVGDDANGWIATDFSSGRVLHIANNAQPRVVLQLSKGIGAAEYISGSSLLIVPELTENRISGYKLSLK
jgi:DNA-binding beta-propeller fold protein YncE